MALTAGELIVNLLIGAEPLVSIGERNLRQSAYRNPWNRSSAICAIGLVEWRSSQNAKLRYAVHCPGDSNFTEPRGVDAHDMDKRTFQILGT
jgi:hypothetical protein